MLDALVHCTTQGLVLLAAFSLPAWLPGNKLVRGAARKPLFHPVQINNFTITLVTIPLAFCALSLWCTWLVAMCVLATGATARLLCPLPAVEFGDVRQKGIEAQSAKMAGGDAWEIFMGKKWRAERNAWIAAMTMLTYFVTLRLNQLWKTVDTLKQEVKEEKTK